MKENRRKVWYLLRIVLTLGILGPAVLPAVAAGLGPPGGRIAADYSGGAAPDEALPAGRMAFALREEAAEAAGLAPDGLPEVAVTNEEDGWQAAEFGPAGGVAEFDEGRLTLFLPPDSISESVVIRLHPADAHVIEGEDVLTGWRFERVGLAGPVYVALPVAEPGAELVLPLSGPGSFYRPALTRHGDGLISARLEELPELMLLAAAGRSNEEELPSPWRYSWQAAAPADFSGAATFAYPIELPPGRRLQPNIDLAYSSRSVDGLIFSDGLDQGPLGLGWSINGIEIVRDKTELDYDGAHYFMKHGDRFTLKMNGQSYELRRSSPVGAQTDYYAVDGPQLRVRQRFSTAAANPDGLYWLVQTPDGVTYRLGFTVDSETGQVVWPDSLLATTGQQHGGSRPDYGSLRWRVDTVTDRLGNQVQYDYFRWEEEPEEYRLDGEAELTRVTSSLARPLEIRYNYAVLAGGPEERLDDSFASKVRFLLGPAPGYRVQAIELYQLEMANPYQTIRFGLGQFDQSNTYCGQGARPSETQVVTFIRQEAGGMTLPEVSLEYELQPHHPHHDQCYQFAYLTEVANGRGARQLLSYQADGRLDQTQLLPRFGQSYFIDRIDAWDGVHDQPAVSEYQFQTPCYDQEMDTGDLGDLPGAVACQARHGLAGYDYGFNGLVGFGQVTIVEKEFGGGENMRRRVISSWLGLGADRPKMGRPWQKQLFDGQGRLLQQESFEYGRDSSPDFDLTYLARHCREDFSGGGPGTQSCRDYEYGRQNGRQYGNVTAVHESGSLAAAGDERHTYLSYYINEADWLVNFPARERTVGPDGVTVLSASWYTYDGQEDWLQPPIDGLRTAVERLESADSGAIRLMEQSFYDDYGNLLERRDPRQNGDFFDYDEQFHLFQVRQVNALGHQQQFSYYGLDMEAGSNPPGLLAEMVAASGEVRRFSYDEFGRLTRTYRAPSAAEFDWQSPQQAVHYLDFERPWAQVFWQKTQSGALAWSDGGVFQRQFYDGHGRVIQSQQAHIDWSGFVFNTAANGGQRVVTDSRYDALGRLEEQSSPYLATAYSGSGSYLAAPDETQLQQQLGYDALGRQVWAVGLDQARESELFGQNSHYLEDGLGNLRAMYLDAYGRLLKVDESLAAYQTAFDAAADLDSWRVRGLVAHDPAGHVAVTGDGSWNSLLQRGLGVSGDEAVSLTFWVDDEEIEANLALRYGSWNHSDYRRWFLRIEAGQLWLGQNEGSDSSYQPLGEVEAGSRYRLLLRSSRSGAYFNLLLWPLDRPEEVMEVRLPQDDSWKQSGWEFVAQVRSSGKSLFLDRYDEMAFFRTYYEYDSLGNLLRLTDSAGNQTSMSYDSLGRKLLMDDPDMGLWQYEYDLAGNLTAETDALGQTVSYAYDALNRLTEKRLDVDGPLLAGYQYDGSQDGASTGRRTSMTAYSPPGIMHNQVSWRYDALGRVLQEDRSVAGNLYTIAFEYSEGDLLTAVYYPGGPDGRAGERVSQDYWWPAARSKELAGNGLYVPGSTDYNAAGQLTRLPLGNGRTSSIEYSTAFQVTRIVNDSGFQDLSLTYDAAGNIAGIEDRAMPGGVWLQAFDYDSLGRLQRESGQTAGGEAAEAVAYGYDSLGNLVSKGADVINYALTGPGSDFAGPHAATYLNGQRAFWYDANGNMVRREIADESWSLHWSAEHRLQKVTPLRAPEEAVQYYYDADGSLILRSQGQKSTVFVGRLYQHNLETGEESRHYYFADRMVARRSGPALYYFLHDHLGSTTTTLDTAGDKAADVRYDSWGAIRWQSQETPTGYRYTGQRFDEASGLYDYLARYYDPLIGRFIRADSLVPDPARPQSLNRYSYVSNNPLRYVDPSGHVAETPDMVGALSEAEAISLEIARALVERYGLPLGELLQWQLSYGEKLTTSILAGAYWLVDDETIGYEMLTVETESGLWSVMSGGSELYNIWASFGDGISRSYFLLNENNRLADFKAAAQAHHAAQEQWDSAMFNLVLKVANLGLSSGITISGLAASSTGVGAAVGVPTTAMGIGLLALSAVGTVSSARDLQAAGRQIHRASIQAESAYYDLNLNQGLIVSYAYLTP